jgi:hypothetical protein
MSDTYSQAACTIAATAAEDSDGGLFVERTPTLLQPRRVDASWSQHPDSTHKEFAYPLTGSYWCDIQELCNLAIERAPLNLRAWVCQERHLSPRIMHFSKTQLFWECYEGMACENYPTGLPRWALPSWWDNTSDLKHDLHRRRLQKAGTSLARLEARRQVPDSEVSPVTDAQLYFDWAVFRIHYTMCKLTKEEDKLVAIQGVAQQFAHALGDQLIAGLWHNRLLEELCWYKPMRDGDPPLHEPTKWRAPTWSWASSNATIWVSCTITHHRDCQHRQIWGKLQSTDVRANASGALEHATLQVQCKPICAARS